MTDKGRVGMVRALLLEKNAEGAVTAAVQEVGDDRLPAGNVTVDVACSTVNYKDGLCLSPTGGGLVRTWPHVAGIDFAGTVAVSDDPRWVPGDRVILTGWHVGERHWGGYATRARVSGDWLVRLPEGMTERQAMAVGTAGLTAMLAIIALEAHGLSPDKGEVLVTGAAGGVGSVYGVWVSAGMGGAGGSGFGAGWGGGDCGMSGVVEGGGWRVCE